MHNITEDISKLKIQESTILKLKDNNLITINDIWILSRKELKSIGLSDSEINKIIISLQLIGLDLNKKIYD